MQKQPGDKLKPVTFGYQLLNDARRCFAEISESTLPLSRFTLFRLLSWQHTVHRLSIALFIWTRPQFRYQQKFSSSMQTTSSLVWFRFYIQFRCDATSGKSFFTSFTSGCWHINSEGWPFTHSTEIIRLGHTYRALYKNVTKQNITKIYITCYCDYLKRRAV